ncbi:urea ABC transporter, permease protein UrtC [Methylibium sp. T29-B]|nr:urea ABC transporter, permease protein UrtC [Methylibium sp. T29-B]
MGLQRSGAYLLFTFLGGAGFFFGPILGAVLMVLAFVLFSEFTQAWLLYLGLVFLIMVMYAPGGLAGLVMMNLRVAAYGRLRPLWPAYLALAGTALTVLAGVGAMIEMVYHLRLDAALGGGPLRYLGVPLEPHGVDSWCGAVLVALAGLGLFELTRREFARRWGAVQQEIAHEIRQKEAS